jgi:hypothetical protein
MSYFCKVYKCEAKSESKEGYCLTHSAERSPNLIPTRKIIAPIDKNIEVKSTLMKRNWAGGGFKSRPHKK